MTDIDTDADIDADIDAKPDSFTLSPSSVTMYKQCPLKWEFRYIKKIREPAGAAAIMGNFVHSVLEFLMKLDPAERTQEKSKTIARKNFDEELTKQQEYIDLQLDEQEALKFRHGAWAAIEGLWSIEDPTQVNVKATEQWLRTEMGGVKFNGIVDRIDDDPEGIAIVDYKTGKFPSRKDSRKEKLDQVFLYAAAYATLHETQPTKVKLYFTKSSETIEEDVSEEALNRVVDDLSATHVDIQTKEFEAQPGPLCGWCFYLDKCEQGQKEVRARHRQGRLKPDAPAVDILGLVA